MSTDRRILSLAWGNTRNKLAEGLYLKTGIDLVLPLQVYGLVNRRCNARCRMCDSWRDKEAIELPASVWSRGMTSLKQLSPHCHVNLSGGEPLLKQDFLEILEHCRKIGLSAGFTTNGILLDEKRIPRILECKPFNINISLDSVEPGVHDDLRGVPGLFDKLVKNIACLRSLMEKTGMKVQVVIKPTVSNRNVGGLAKLAEFARENGLSGVHYQPILEWSAESKEMFNLDLGALSDSVSKLIEMRRSGYPILNSESSMAEWGNHFRGARQSGKSPCTVALRSLTIGTDGHVALCTMRMDDSVIGSIANDDITTMWRSDTALKIRRKLVKCRRLCTATCVVKRRLRDYLYLYRRFTR